MKNALPDSGTNHDTALATVVAEMLGFTTRDHVKCVWGDTDLAPLSNAWYAGCTITFQGAAVCSATDRLRKDLLRRAADFLKVDIAKLQMVDGVISSTEDPKKRVSFVELVAAHKGPIKQQGRGGLGERTGFARNKGTGVCFVEVEVDTLKQVDQALDAGADILLLDNMTTDDIREAVRRCRGRAKTEISGGVTLARIPELASTGADFVSAGALTHSAPAVDIGFDIQPA